MSTTIFKALVSRPTHLGRKPRTAAELLRQTHQYLEEEGKWIKGTMFKDGDAKAAYENGFCGKWGACAVGALGIVAGDFTPGVEMFDDTWDDDEYEEDWRDYYWVADYDDQNDLVYEACGYLALIIDPRLIASNLGNWTTVELVPCDIGTTGLVIDWNDDNSRRRKQVLNTFAKAAALASRPGTFDKVARKYLAENGYLDTDD